MGFWYSAPNLEVKQLKLKTPIVLVLSFALLEGLTHFGNLHGDSMGYISMVHWFMGQATAEEAIVHWRGIGQGNTYDEPLLSWHGFLRPVVPGLATPLAFIFGASTAIAIVNLGFLLLGTFFTYLFTARFFKNDLLGYIAGVCYASAGPTLVWGVAVQTDGPAYAMLAVMFYTLCFWSRPGVKSGIVTGVLLGLSLLVKEITIVLAFLMLFLLLSQRTKERLTYTIVALGIAAAISLSWGLLVVGKTYLSFYGEGIRYAGGAYAGAFAYPVIFYDTITRGFHALIPFLILGFFLVEDKHLKVLVRILLAGSVLLLAWPTLPEIRFTFILFPVVIPLAAFGMDHAATILANRTWFRLFTKTQWVGIILAGIILYTNCYYYFIHNYFRLPTV